MNKFEIEKEGIAITGPEEDYFQITNGNNEEFNIAISDLLEPVNVPIINWDTISAFELIGTESHTDEFWNSKVNEYREETGREFPPIYKVKFIVEAEPLSEEETKKFWEKKIAENTMQDVLK